MRYNRVEALSVGVHSGLDLGRLTLDGTARLGIADLEPNAELSVATASTGSVRRITGYRRLAAANPDTRPFGFGNSFKSLFFGTDDGEYLRAAGAEFIAKPPVSADQWYDLRLYGEHQTHARRETDFSVPHLLDSDQLFRPNIDAAKADQLGAALTLRTTHGFDPEAFRWGGELYLAGETGTYRFARPGLMLRAVLPVAGLALAVEGGAGTSTGEVPVQGDWYLGGPATLRGYDGGVLHGTSCWRSRVELSRNRPAARLTLFSDAGWAGSRDEFALSHPLVSAGAGLSFFDNLVRLDLARGLRAPLGWRADLYLSASF